MATDAYGSTLRRRGVVVVVLELLDVDPVDRLMRPVVDVVDGAVVDDVDVDGADVLGASVVVLVVDVVVTWVDVVGAEPLLSLRLAAHTSPTTNATSPTTAAAIAVARPVTASPLRRRLVARRRRAGRV